VADAILVSLTKAVATALSAGTFEWGTIEVGWDFDNRIPNKRPADGELEITANVPMKYESIARGSRTELDRVAVVDVVIQKSFGTESQQAGPVAKDEINKLVRLAEQMHSYFQETLSESRLTLADHGLIAEWIDERTGVEATSELSVAYSPKYLGEAFQFVAICREVFELTAGTA
jgi:hypothetical protein